MTGHSRNPEDHSPMSFMDCIEKQDHQVFLDEWRKLVEAKEEVAAELRLKKPWIRKESDEAVRDTTWILFLALPQFDDDGNLTKVMGCSTDISHFKYVSTPQPLLWLLILSQMGRICTDAKQSAGRGSEKESGGIHRCELFSRAICSYTEGRNR